MPANYITFPGTDDQIFGCESSPTHLLAEVTLDLDFLAGMGTFTIPRPIWEATSRYACWIEPAIVDRWCELMGRYDEKAGIGTVVATMLPYSIFFIIFWSIFFFTWTFLLGLPVGPGSPTFYPAQ